MKLGPMTRKWLIVIIVAIAVALIAVWLYTAYAAEEVESDVAEDEVTRVEPASASPSAPYALRVLPRLGPRVVWPRLV